MAEPQPPESPSSPPSPPQPLPPPLLAQIINAPSRPRLPTHPSIFLAGTVISTTASSPSTTLDWRQTLISSLADLPLTIFNPLRPDWDSTWKENIDFPPFREQVEWELDMMECADLVVVYFGPNTVAPISLLEFGLFARTGNVLVVCHRGYPRRGNVCVVARRFGVEMLDEEGDVVGVVRRRLGVGG